MREEVDTVRNVTDLGPDTQLFNVIWLWINQGSASNYLKGDEADDKNTAHQATPSSAKVII